MLMMPIFYAVLMTTDTKQVIYSMMRVGRIHPPNKQVLRDISLGFYYGAKIGVLGLNGAGKSTLLRIMAGADQDYVGEIAKSPGYTVGLLSRNRSSTSPKPSSKWCARPSSPSWTCWPATTRSTPNSPNRMPTSTR
jgi:ABC-type ATPase with predicted acetyltransferase domain